MKDLITEAVRYWEPRRLVYNGVLTIIVIVHAWPVLPNRWSGEWLPGLAALFVLAVAANVAYCAAYPVDLFLQCSDFRETWRRYRWGLFVIGLLVWRQSSIDECGGILFLEDHAEGCPSRPGVLRWKNTVLR